MCKAIDDLIKDGELRGEERGRQIGEEHGRRAGEDRVLTLISRLLQDDKIQLVPQITEDVLLREKLYLQYQI